MSLAGSSPPFWDLPPEPPVGTHSMDFDAKGKTLWEMLMERLGKSSNGAGIAFSNPKDLRIGSVVNVPYANGPEFVGYDFGVQEIREYNRQIGGQEFRFTDYVLKEGAPPTVSRPGRRRNRRGPEWRRGLRC